MRDPEHPRGSVFTFPIEHARGRHGIANALSLTVQTVVGPVIFRRIVVIPAHLVEA